MGWVKRLADHVIQDRIGDADLEFAWSDLKTIEPKEQAELLAIYVKEGIKTRNEARGLLGDDPLPGGDALIVDTPQGPLPLAPRLPSPPFRAEREGPRWKSKYSRTTTSRSRASAATKASRARWTCCANW
jgi:hypothetical protein